MIEKPFLEWQEGGANYRLKWQSYFSILRALGALYTENTVSQSSCTNRRIHMNACVKGEIRSKSFSSSDSSPPVRVPVTWITNARARVRHHGPCLASNLLAPTLLRPKSAPTTPNVTNVNGSSPCVKRRVAFAINSKGSPKRVIHTRKKQDLFVWSECLIRKETCSFVFFRNIIIQQQMARE